MNRRSTWSWLLLSLLAIGCAGDAAYDSGGATDPGGGGNVGFGGAQDIGQFRRILDAGDIPGPNTLDANGFFNEHYTRLPAPDCGQELCAHAMLSVGPDWIDSRLRTTLQIALNTPRTPDEIERLPLNLVVVVDTSGSMAEDGRLDFAKLGLHGLINALQEGDRLALVTYSSTVTVWNDLSESLPASELHDIVSDLVPVGSTNIHGGLSAGFELSAAAFDLARQNRVILLSDGLATAGIVDDAAILSMSERHIATGIGLTTIGVGLDFNVELMRGLAERGAGNFYFLEDASAIEEVFTEEVDTFMSPLALDIELEVVADGAYSLGEVVGTRSWTTAGVEGLVTIPAAFLASRTDENPGPNGRRGGGSTLFVEMIPRSQFEDPYKVALVRLSYQLPGSAERLVQTIAVTNRYQPTESPEGGEYYSADVVADHDAMYRMFLGLRAATTAAQTDYSCASQITAQLEAQARAWNLRHEDVDLAADIDLVEQLSDNLAARSGGYGSCTDGSDPYPPDDYPPGDGYYDDDVTIYGCSAAGGAGGGAAALLAVLAAIAAIWRRRGRLTSTGSPASARPNRGMLR